jgi:hypothetical protein
VPLTIAGQLPAPSQLAALVYVAAEQVALRHERLAGSTEQVARLVPSHW